MILSSYSTFIAHTYMTGQLVKTGTTGCRDNYKKNEKVSNEMEDASYPLTAQPHDIIASYCIATL